MDNLNPRANKNISEVKALAINHGGFIACFRVEADKKLTCVVTFDKDFNKWKVKDTPDDYHSKMVAGDLKYAQTDLFTNMYKCSKYKEYNLEHADDFNNDYRSRKVFLSELMMSLFIYYISIGDYPNQRSQELCAVLVNDKDENLEAEIQQTEIELKGLINQYISDNKEKLLCTIEVDAKIVYDGSQHRLVIEEIPLEVKSKIVYDGEYQIGEIECSRENSKVTVTQDKHGNIEIVNINGCVTITQKI
jgi:hypothetical protein